MRRHSAAAARHPVLLKLAIAAGAVLVVVAALVVWHAQVSGAPAADDPDAGLEDVGPVEVVPYVPDGAEVADVEPGDVLDVDPYLLPDGTATVHVGKSKWAVVEQDSRPQESVVKDMADYMAGTFEHAHPSSGDLEDKARAATAMESQAIDVAVAFDKATVIHYQTPDGEHSVWAALVIDDTYVSESREASAPSGEEAMSQVEDWLGEKGLDPGDWLVLDLTAADGIEES